METSFFSGSENLYKYLVTVGILLIVLTVYYPLKEKQELELLSIKIENELKILNYSIIENQKEVESFKKSFKNPKLTEEVKTSTLKKIKEINKKNNIDQITLENKTLELSSRKVYIKTYKVLFWIFFPLGIFLVIFGFIKWNTTKKVDDKILELEKRKLEIEVKNLENENP